MEKVYMEDHLTCPICFEIPPNEIIQCRKGHQICGDCRKSLVECPQCRIPYGKEDIRNLAMESLLDSMEFPCPFKEEGCPDKIIRKDLVRHGNSCKFSPVTKLFCSRNLGWKDCKSAIDESSVLTHLEEQHPVKNVDCSTFQISLEYQELSPEENVDIYFDPLVLTSLTTPIVLRTVMTGTSHLALTCFMFRDAEVVDVVERFRVNYCVELDKGASITWSGCIQSYRQFEEISNRNSFCIPMQCLEELANQIGTSAQSGNIDEQNINIKVVVFKEIGESTEPVMWEEAIHTVNISEQIRLPHGQGPSVVFRGVRCNICKAWPIKTLRYKCLQCPDYDLCKKCVEQGHHNHHFFVRLHDMSQSAQFYNQFWRRPATANVAEKLSKHQ